MFKTRESVQWRDALENEIDINDIILTVKGEIKTVKKLSSRAEAKLPPMVYFDNETKKMITWTDQSEPSQYYPIVVFWEGGRSDTEWLVNLTKLGVETVDDTVKGTPGYDAVGKKLNEGDIIITRAAAIGKVIKLIEKTCRVEFTATETKLVKYAELISLTALGKAEEYNNKK